jgi:class 3 adenylate cyclase
VADLTKPSTGSAVEGDVTIRTFLLADFRGYTRFTREQGDEVASDLAGRFARLVRETADEFDGELLELRRDEALCVFVSARRALQAAVEIQRRLRTPDGDDWVFPLGVGMGVDAGEAVPIEGGYRGAALNMAGRLVARAAPGQILATERVVGLASRVEGVRWGSAKPVRLKGLDRPERVVVVESVEPIPPPPAQVPQSSRGGTRSKLRRRRWQLALAGGVLVAAAAGAAILSDSAGVKRIVSNSLVQLDPRTGKPIVVKQVGIEPLRITITPTAIWTVDSNDVSRYDLKTGTVDTSGITPAQPFDIAFDRTGNAWVTSSSEVQNQGPNAFATQVRRGPGLTSPGLLDPGSWRVSQMELPLPMAGFEANGAGHLWVIVGGHGPLPGDNKLAVVDPRTSQITALNLDESAVSIAHGYDTLWLGTYGAGGYGNSNPRMYKDDIRLEAIRDGKLEAIEAGRSKPLETVLQKHGASWGPGSIATGDGAVWVMAPGQLFKINPITLQIEHRLDLAAGSVAVGAGAVWAAGHHSVIKIDPRTDTVIHEYPVHRGFACALAATSTSLWLAVGSRPC